MSFAYRLMYRVGFTPWDSGQVPSALRELVEGPDAIAPARALDVGCGTGTQAVYLAQNGWRVTGVDAVARPLARARAHAQSAGVSVDWVKGDVTRLSELRLEPGFSLLLDRGCFHGLNDSGRAACAAGLTELAAPAATLLMMAFAPNRIPVAPVGIEESELLARFAGWRLESTTPDEGEIAGPLRNVPRTWYRLVRESA
jgi:SAM-dependent methyltransferase